MPASLRDQTLDQERQQGRAQRRNPGVHCQLVARQGQRDWAALPEHRGPDPASFPRGRPVHLPERLRQQKSLGEAGEPGVLCVVEAE